jgi:hypothetical protein
MKKFYSIYFKRIIAIIAFLINAIISFSQSVRSTVDKKDILIGERITNILTIDLPSPEYTVNLTVPDSIPHFEILQKNGGNGKTQAGADVWQYTIIFTSFDSGSFTFPGLAYRITHLNTASQLLSTDPIKVNVGYMPLDKGEQPRDIKTIIEVAYTDYFWWIVGAGILLLLIILFFVYRYFKKKKKTPVIQSSKGAYEEAMQSLAELRKLNEQGGVVVKEYHTKLADVLRTYYGRTFNQNYQNKTTQEILSKLKSHELNAETATHATEALATGDAVKFAKYHPSFTENEAALNYLKTVIEEIETSRIKKD